MDFVAFTTLTLNGNVYERGDVIAPADVPTTNLRRFLDKGLIDVIGGGASGSGATGPTGPTGPVGTGSPITANHTTVSLAESAIEKSTISLGRSYGISKIQTDIPARVRLYVNTATQNADESRVIGVLPVGNHGVILDVVTVADALTWFITPSVMGRNDTASVPISITNLSNATDTVTATITALVMES